MQRDQQLCYLSCSCCQGPGKEPAASSPPKRTTSQGNQGPAAGSGTSPEPPSHCPGGWSLCSASAWSWWLCLVLVALCPSQGQEWMLLQLPSKLSSWKDSRQFLCSLQGGGSSLLPFSCCTTFLHLPSFNVLIKWLIKEVIHEKDGYLDKAQRLVAALSPQISILHETERQKRQIFVPLSFHHCSSKDQSLQKINLKENF